MTDRANEDAIAALIEALNLRARRPEDRRAAARMLGWMGPRAEAAVPTLIEALADPDRKVTALAARAISKVGAAGVPALLVALKDLAGRYRLSVIVVLGELGPEAAAAVPALLQALQADDAEVRREVIETLGLTGPPARDAIVALQQLRADEALRPEIDRAIRCIRRGPVAQSFHLHQRGLQAAALGFILVTLLALFYDVIARTELPSVRMPTLGVGNTVALAWSIIGGSLGATIGAQVRGRRGAWWGAITTGLSGAFGGFLLGELFGALLRPLTNALVPP